MYVLLPFAFALVSDVLDQLFVLLFASAEPKESTFKILIASVNSLFISCPIVNFNRVTKYCNISKFTIVLACLITVIFCQLVRPPESRNLTAWSLTESLELSTAPGLL